MPHRKSDVRRHGLEVKTALSVWRAKCQSFGGGTIRVETMTAAGRRTEHISWKAQRISRRGDCGEFKLRSALVTSLRAMSAGPGTGASLQSSE